jgi:hypothetical protein
VSTDEWCTPKFLAEALGPFDVDPCSNVNSHIRITDRGYAFRLDHPDPELRDGLAKDWNDFGSYSFFVNFPYSKPLPWCEKLRDHRGPWCVLAKLDPTTKWWAALMEVTPTVAPFRKRLRFEGDKSMTANFPSVLVYSAWRPPAALVPHLWLPSYAQTRAA